MDVADMVDATPAAGARSVLADRLTTYADAVSFEKGARPAPLLTDVERADLIATETAWGQSRGILLLIDRMMTMISPAARVDFARMLAAAEVIRGDQALVIGRFVVWLLSDRAHGARNWVRNARVAAAIETVVEAHRRTLEGETLGRTEWSAVRSKTMTDSSADDDGRASHFAALCVEAAAWSPKVSPTVGAQTLEPWSHLAAGIVDAEQGWALADYDILQGVQRGIWEETAEERGAGRQPDLKALMYAREPELAARWDRHVEQQRILMAERMKAACDALVVFLTDHRA